MKLLQKLAKGQSKEEQQKLVDAACALVHCSSGLINGPEKEKLEEQEERGKSYVAEQSLLLKTGQFRYGLKGYAEDAASRVYNEAKSAGRGAYNLGYLLATHGPYGNVQTPHGPFDDHNGPKLGGGTVTAFPMPICAPGLPVGTCTVAPALGVGVGLRGSWPSNALLSDGGDTGWNGNSTISSEAAPASGANTAGTAFGPPRMGLDIPQGLPPATFDRVSGIVRATIDRMGLGDDVFVMGSHAGGTANVGSDLDIGVRVTAEQFDQMIAKSFAGAKNARAATMEVAVRDGRIQACEAGLSSLGKSVAREVGLPPGKVQISVIRAGGLFDNGPQSPLAYTFK